MTIKKSLNQRRFKEAVVLLVTLSLMWGLLPVNVPAMALGDDGAEEEATEQVFQEGDAVTAEEAAVEEVPEEVEPEEETTPAEYEVVDEVAPSEEGGPEVADAAVADAQAEAVLAARTSVELTSQADNPTSVDEVVVGVVAPTAGETSATAPDVSAWGEGFTVRSASWCDAEGNGLGSTVTFVAGETYHLSVTVVADEGYAFPQGSSGTTFAVEGGLLKSSSVTNWMDDKGAIHSYADLVASVEATAPSSFFGVLISDAEGTANAGGSYFIDYPGMDGSPSRTSASNNFVEDGKSVYLEAYPDEGYKFAGWYQGDPEKAAGKLYVGEPLSTETAYQFTAPISLTRPYICAVFEEDDTLQGDQVQMWVGNTKVIGPDSSAQGGKVAVKYTPSSDVYSGITAKDGTNYVAGEVLQFYKGDECTVYQQADEGFRFVGWYHVNIEWAPGETLAWEGEAISTEASFTYKPGVTVVAGDSEPLRYVCAVFEEDAVETYTVSFDPGTGQGSMDSATVKAGEEYELPSCGFTHANPARTFYKWSVDGELKSPGDTITVSKDTEVIAQWLDTGRAKTIDTSVDRSNSEVVGTLLLTDARTGEVTEVVAFDEVTASEFTQPSNPTVQAMIGEAKESAAAKAQEIAAGHNVTIISENVSDPRIEKMIDNRTHMFFVDADDAGDYAMYLIVDGEWAHHWRYDVTVKAEFGHTPADPVSENVVEPTCTKAGSHEEVVYCSSCGEEISRKSVTDPALGHAWGAWVVDVEATDEAEGLQHRTCSRCKEVEEQVIPKVKVVYELAAGAGQTHVLEDGLDLAFTFKRNVRDEVAFDHFTGVRVDGRLLSDKAYTAEAGSVVATLKASYLDTLGVGEHTLTAQFDDADDVDVTFTVATEEEPAPAPEPKKDDAKPSKGKALPQTGDVFALVSLVSLTLALLGLAMTLAGRRIHDC